MSWWTDIIDIIAPASQGNVVGTGAALGGSSIGSDITDSTGFFGAVTGFLTAMTDVHFWASLGWILLGVILMFIALSLWLKKQDVLPDVVPVPV